MPNASKNEECLIALQGDDGPINNTVAIPNEKQLQLERDLTSDNTRAAERAYTVLYEEYRPRLLAFISKNFGSQHAEDIVQDTLMSAWTHRQRFTAGTNFKSWIFQMAQNKALDIVNRSEYKLRVDLGPDKQAEPIHHDAPITNHVASEELYPTFKRLLLPLLPPVQKTIFELFLQGKSYNEIHDITGKSIGNVGNAISLAKEKINNYLSELPEHQRGDLREIIDAELKFAEEKRGEDLRNQAKQYPHNNPDKLREDLKNELALLEALREKSEQRVNPNNTTEINSEIRRILIQKTDKETLYKDVPPLHRKIMNLRLEGLTATEISKRTHFTEEQIHRALANILTLNKTRELKEFQARARAELEKEIESTPHPSQESPTDSEPQKPLTPQRIDEKTDALVFSNIDPKEITKGLPPQQSKILRLRLQDISPKEISKRTGYTVEQIYRVIARAQEMHTKRLAQKSAQAKQAAQAKKMLPLSSPVETARKAIRTIKEATKKAEDKKFFYDKENPLEMGMLQKIAQLPTSRSSTFAEAQGPWFMKMFFENLSTEEGATYFGISKTIYSDRLVRVKRELQQLIGTDYTHFAQSPAKLKEYMDAHFEKMTEEHSQKFMLALAQLGPLQRDVYRLFVLEGKSHEEIAHIHRMTHKAVLSNLSHARENLGSILGENYESLFWMSPSFRETCKKYNDPNDPNFLQNKLMFGLAYLTPPQRDAFYRVFIDGQSTKEAAEELKILQGSVYDNAKAAADNLRQDLGEETFNACFPNGLKFTQEN